MIRQCRRRRRTSRRGRRDQTFPRTLISVRPRCQDERVPDRLQRHAAAATIDKYVLTKLDTVASINKTGRSHDGPPRITYDVNHTGVDRKAHAIVECVPNNTTTVDIELLACHQVQAELAVRLFESNLRSVTVRKHVNVGS